MNLYENNKRNDMLKRLSSFLLAVTMANSASACVSNISVEKEVKVSKHTRSLLYSYNRYILGGNMYSYDDAEDIFITDKTLKNLEKLSIDGQNYDDLSYLEHCENIESLVISNIELIKPEDMKYILGVSNIDELSIKLFANNLIKNPNFKLDLSKFSNVKKLKIFSGFSLNPMEDNDLVDTVICYSAICDSDNNIDEAKISFNGLNHEEIETIKSIYSKCLEVVQNIKNISSKDERILSLINYLANSFEYDEKVQEEVENGDFFTDKGTESRKLAKDYNVNILEPFMSDKNGVFAVCANYAATFTLLCYMSGIECYTVTGNCMDVPHAWNYVNREGEYYIVDPTSLDSLFEGPYDIIYKSIDAYYYRALKGTDDIWSKFYKPNKTYKDIIGKDINSLPDKKTEYCNNEQKMIVKIKNQNELKLAVALLLISVMLEKYSKNYNTNSIQFTLKKKGRKKKDDNK